MNELELGLSMRAKLTVLRGSNKGKTILVAKPQYVVGRGEKCQLRLNHEAISRHHCAFLLTDEHVLLKDLGSRNGTLVNGAKIEKKTKLKTGDEIQFGPLSFSVEITDAAGKVIAAETKAKAESESSGDSGVISDWLSDAVPGSAKADSMATTRMFKFDAPEPKPEKEEKKDDSTADETQTIKDSDTKKILGGKKKKKKKREPAKLPESKKKTGIGENTQEAAAETLRRLFTRGS